MKSGKQPHILNASSNLLGICFILITCLKVTRANTIADEIAILAGVCFMASCLLSYLSIRSEEIEDKMERLADYFFLAGLLTLFTSVIIFSTAVL